MVEVVFIGHFSIQLNRLGSKSYAQMIILHIISSFIFATHQRSIAYHEN